MKNMRSSLVIVAAFSTLSVLAAAPFDDAHNHDGTHVEGQENCGTNYMLPGEVARLGSHSFMILGQDGPDHVIAEHRSGTPPHNYQYVLRVRLDKSEMKDYQAILKTSKTLPAFTTIYFDNKGKQVDRTFFCLTDLPKIFGSEKKPGDSFEKLFPIRASLQKNADHEGGFEIEKSVVKGKYLSLNRDDVELILFRYIPSYLAQDLLRKAIEANPSKMTSLFEHAPITATEDVATASKRKSYMQAEGGLFNPARECSRNTYLKNTRVAETIHTFVLLAESGKNTVLATHYYDYSPQNFQTVVKLKLNEEQMKTYREAKQSSKSLPLFQTRVQGKGGSFQDSYFCMDSLRNQIKNNQFRVSGTVYKDSVLDAYKLGSPVGRWDLSADNLEVLVNRRLESLMNPQEVAADVAKNSTKAAAPGAEKSKDSSY